MKKIAKIAAVLLSGVMEFSFTACNKEDDEYAVNRVSEALEIINEAESMKSDMVMSYSMVMGEEKVDMFSWTYIEMFNSPAKIKMDMSTEVLGQELLTQYYMEETEAGVYTMYYASEDMGTGWTKMVVDASYAEELTGNSEYYLEYAENFKLIGEEDVEGENTEKFEGVIKSEDIKEVVSETNLDSIAGVEGVESELSALFDDLEDIPITIWISKESGYPVKYTMDITQMMQSVIDNAFEMEESTEAIELGIENAVIDIVYSDFNAVEEFEIPAEVIENAVDLTIVSE